MTAAWIMILIVGPLFVLCLAIHGKIQDRKHTKRFNLARDEIMRQVWADVREYQRWRKELFRGRA